MHIKNYGVFFLFGCAAPLLAQNGSVTPAWNVQTYGFVARYHSAIDYEPGTGVGLSIGHSIRKNWLSGAVGFEYTHAEQELRLIGGLYETRVDIYQSFLALHGRWPLKKGVLAIGGSLLNGWSFFRPRPLAINAGTLGQITLHPSGETKFVAAWSSGLECRLVDGLAILFSIKQNFSRFAYRQVDAVQTRMKWQSYWNYGFGLSWNF